MNKDIFDNFIEKLKDHELNEKEIKNCLEKISIIEETFLNSIALFGKEIQSRLAMEECAELIQAINKCLRYPDVEERKNNLIEEICDVEIMLFQLKVLFGINQEDIIKMKVEKAKREKDRIQAFIQGKVEVVRMNKYEKALEELSFPLMSSDCGGCKCGESDCSCEKREAVETLQELVDKATPKKVVYKKGSDGERWFFCPKCNEIVPRTSNFNQHTYPYCPYCGQKFDWDEYFSDR